jgi:hypothetical protein
MDAPNMTQQVSTRETKKTEIASSVAARQF